MDLKKIPDPPKPAEPEWKPAGKPHLFKNAKGELSYRPPVPPLIGPFVYHVKGKP